MEARSGVETPPAKVYHVDLPHWVTIFEHGMKKKPSELGDQSCYIKKLNLLWNLIYVILLIKGNARPVQFS